MRSINESRNKFSQKLTDFVIDKMKIQINIKDDEKKNVILFDKKKLYK